MADEDKPQNNSEGGPGAHEASDTAPQTAEEKAESRATKKSRKLFVLLVTVNLLVVFWVFYSLRYDAGKKSKTRVESSQKNLVDVDSLIHDSNAIAIEPFLVNVVARHKGRARLGQKVLRIRFEVVPATANTELILEKRMPKLRDQVNMLLSSQDYAELALSDGREALRRILKETINEVIHPEEISEVYYTEFVIN